MEANETMLTFVTPAFIKTENKIGELDKVSLP
jgi:hypothetical protein